MDREAHGVPGVAEIDEEFAAGLSDVEGFSHLILGEARVAARSISRSSTGTCDYTSGFTDVPEQHLWSLSTAEHGWPVRGRLAAPNSVSSLCPARPVGH